MRRYPKFLTVIGALIFGLAAPALARETLMLRENWQVQSSAKISAAGPALSAAAFQPQGWYPTTAPATVLAVLTANNVFPDPYYGLNMRSIPGYVAGRWLAMPEDSPFYPPWWYRTCFRLPESFRGRRLVLHLDGINYRANVWLNGQKIGDAADVIGMFRRFEFDVSDRARFGEDNCLAVEVSAPGKLPHRKYVTKQLEATTGWDDHNPQPPDSNVGLWQDVYVTATGPVRIQYPYVSTKLDLPTLAAAHLTVSATVVNVTKETARGELRVQIENIAFVQPIELAPGESRLVKFTPDQFPQLNIQKPRVWWPNLVGAQELYDLKLEFFAGDKLSDAESARFGIREVTTYINDEGWRVYQVNGRDILIRGGAWMTSDMMLRLSRHRYEALIRYAREANFNMLRSEGFSIRETDDFYNLCDQYGIMVTQQIFGRSIPDEALAIACVKDMMLRIRNHPSLVHFLGHDETFPTPTLDKAYRDLIAEYTPERTYQPHSGAFNIKDRFETGGTRTGTLELWTCAGPAHYYTHKEDGAWGFAQSGGIGGVVASLESIKRMMPAAELWPLWTEAWSYHTVIQGGEYFNYLLKFMKARYDEPQNLEDFVLTAHAMNYESARGMYEAYGRNKYAATGITTWKYDAAWPAAMTWAYVDWYLLPTGAYYGAKKACEPLHVQYSYDDNSVYVVNGRYRAEKGLTVTAKIYNLDLTEKYSRAATVDVGEDGKTEAFVIEWPHDLSKTYFLYLALQDSAGRQVTDNFYWLSTVPDARIHWLLGLIPLPAASHADLSGLRSLPKTRLNATCRIEERGSEKVARLTLTNSTSQLAFFIQLAVTKGQAGFEVAPSYWSENDFALLPGQTKELEAVFAAADLEGKAPVVRVGGWNVEKTECIP